MPKKGVNVSRACDTCRKRKKRCDGIEPVCGLCQRKGESCVYLGEDGRKNAHEIGLLRARIEALESKLGETAGSDQTSSPPFTSPSGITEQPMQDLHMSVSVSPINSFDQHTHDSQVQPPFPYAGQTCASVNILLSPPRSPGSTGPPWSRFLAPIDIDKAQHDLAIQTFVSYYSPWCCLIDPDRFLSDMAAMPDAAGHDTGYMTAHYSAMLHNAMYFTGTYMLKERWPDVMERLDNVFWGHVNKYVSYEGDQPTLASLSGFIVLSSCHSMRMKYSVHLNAGYIQFGLAYATVFSCLDQVAKGLLSYTDRDQRMRVYWVTWIQDTLRAIACGRQPLFPDVTEVPFPNIDAEADSKPWLPPRPLAEEQSIQGGHGRETYPGAGLPSMVSTTLFWQAKLSRIIKAILAEMSSRSSDNHTPSRAFPELVARLEDWYTTCPLPPPDEAPLPHIILLNLFYHTACVFLLRPFYQQSLDALAGGNLAARCDLAASESLRLSKLYDQVHGIQRGPMSLIFPVFASATVFILRASTPTSHGYPDLQLYADVEACIALVAKLAITWNEAHRGLGVLLSLKDDMLRHSSESSPAAAAEQGAATLADSLLDTSWMDR